MQTVRKPTGQFARRLGRAVSRSARWLQRREHQAISWLVAKGLPATVAAALLWIVKLAVAAGLLYTAFWLAMLLMFAVIASWAINNTSSDDDELAEWRVGLSGYGLYRGDTRVDPGQPDDEN
ncbi:conserved hypothetical protein [Nitrosomonas eutropha C91]|uniref:Uncharacterized protein DUF3742 n=3 Tax=Nitrosomonas eutropha TaxID=916 RepID=A0ABX5MDC2_9PROT|nr:conserved hypothetical protein [Nitrosomonas eutropha C91]PXV84185.1 uncharacterized protein DUF3742 [Nitrosomonas eutropha]